MRCPPVKRILLSATITAGTLALGIAATNLTADAAPKPKRGAGGTDTGLAQSLHAMRREGRLLCLTDHFHVGSSSGQPSRAKAAAAAMQDWSSFTAWEYGTLWGSFKQAAGKTVTCDGAGTSWNCTVSARACRR